MLRQWQADRGSAQGEMLSVAQVWELSKRWYQNRLSLDYRGRSVAQVEEIFRSLHLTSEFWYVNEPPKSAQK